MSGVRVGIIGVGRLGSRHLRNLLLLQQDGLAHVVGFYDIHPRRIQEIQQTTGVRAFSDWKGLLEEVEAVVVASPTSTHYFYAREALEQSRHIFVEKPLCTRTEEAEHLTRLAQRTGVITQVGFVERFNPAFRWGRLLLSSSTSSVISIHADRWAPFTPRGADVSVVLDLLSHDLDLVLLMMEAEPVRISAQGAAILTSAPDLVQVHLEFPEHRIAWLTVSRIALTRRRLFQVYASGSLVRMNLLRRTLQYLSLSTLSDSHPVRRKASAGYRHKQTVFEHPESGNRVVIHEYDFHAEGEDALYMEMRVFLERILFRDTSHQKTAHQRIWEEFQVNTLSFAGSLRLLRIIDQIHHQLQEFSREFSWK